MDSTHAAPRRALRWAATSAIFAGALAICFSSARADDLVDDLPIALSAVQNCTVQDKVVRDGIVSLPLESAPPPAPLDLISLGTIDDPARNVTYSVWRVVNSNAISYRADLQAPGGERVPLLVRAGAEVTLRSDSLDGTTSHSLIVDNATVEQASIAAATFADPRVLTGADCMFEGNPLYAGEHAGTLKISTVHGAVIAEIPGTLDLSAIATSQPRGELVTLRGNSLRMFDWDGSEIANVTLPSTATAGASGRQRLAVDGEGDNIWVAIGATLYRLGTDGQISGSVTYPEEIREINLGQRRRLWVVLESDVHVVEHDSEAVGTIAEVTNLSLPSDVTAISYDSYWSQTHVVAGSTLFKYDLDGILIESVPLAVSQPILQLAADGTGGMWASSVDRLFRLQSDGLVAVEVDAFATGTAIVDLAGDPADGTAWVTSGSRIRHFVRDGALLHDLLPAASGGGTRQFRFLELFADRTPPYVRMVSPVRDSIVNTPRPTLEIEYNDPAGRGVATETLEILTDDEQPLPVDCDAGPASASCTPTVDLPEGEVVLWPRAYDLAGNLSGPRPHAFTVESGTGTVPRIRVSYPYHGMVTNTPSLTMRGEVEDATGLTLNGDPLTIFSGYRFYRDIQLVEGPNLLQLIAANGSGASTQLDINVVLDTIPPGVPDVSLIQVTLDEEPGHLRVSAPAGTFEPFAWVNIFNDDVGYTTRVVANADGSLSSTVSAEPGDRLLIWQEDEAGNEGEAVELPYGIDQLSLTISSSPATVTSRDLVIRGTFTGPADASITANGIVAGISGGSGSVRDFAVRVPLAVGQNTIQVVAVAPGRPQVTQSITVTRSGDDPFRIEASDTDGPASLEVYFTLQHFDATRIQRVEADFEGDGVTDLVSEASRIGTLVHQYLVPGNYTATFRVFSTTNTSFTYQVPVVVYTVAERDVAIQVTWQKFRTALAAGDTTAALDFMLPSAAARYSSVFTALQSSLPRIVASFSVIYPTNAPGLAEYVMTREVNGQPTAFLVYFARGSDGAWRIASM